MADNPSAQSWTVWPGDELYGVVRTSEDQAQIAHGVWFGGRR